uniref:Growth-regulating factor n=1 Tax=Hordeum vulgare subsp. vulgare TaxID=112509 RepID=F2EBI7_HORVV|nr:predicted protein [Hordeum vulgare subsp. vulgare]
MLSSCAGGGGGHPGSPQKHGRCEEQEAPDGFLETAGASPAPPSSCSFLGTTGFPRAQMLSFSNDVAGLGLSSGTSMQGFLARVRGPFTPTQWMELEHQALIYKHIAAKAPVPSSWLLPIRRSLNPWAGWAPFRSSGADVEPRRCRRTDGKKWRCSRDSVGDQKYCERHINHGRQRSRKHVEGRKMTTTVVEQTMAVSGGFSSHCQAVAWQQQVKSLAANVTDPFPRQSNREPLEKQSVVEQSLVSTTMHSFDFSSSHSSSNCDKVAFLPLKLHHDLDQSYITHGAGSSSEKGYRLQETWSPVTRETLDDGPLGEVFRSKSCQSAYGTS